MPHEKSRVVDVETSGLDWKQNHIVGYAIAFSGDPRDSYYIPFRHLGNANVGGRNGPTMPTGWDRKLAPGEAELIGALDQRETLIIGHNLAFDLRMMAPVGFTMRPRFEDTQINEPILDEFVGRYSLDSCAHRHKVTPKLKTEIVSYLMSKFSKITRDPKTVMGHFWRLAGNDKMAVDYARGDGTTTFELRDAQMVQIRKTDTFTYSRPNPRTNFVETITEDVPSLEQVHDIESRLIPVLARMMIRGVKVDESRLKWMFKHVNEELGVVRKELEKFSSDFNVRGPLDVKAWMEAHGCTDWPYTNPSRRFPQGQPSFNEKWLEKHLPGKTILKVRKLENLRSSFMEPLRDTHIYKGRVYTTFNQLRTDEYGTVTGRLSSSEPNMQQVPKHNKELGRLFRSAFVPDDGMIWGEDDYSQIEPRLLAYYTRCAVLLDDYRTNPKADAHMAVTREINKDRLHTMSPEEIQAYRDDYGKRINQTLITGGGKGVLVEKYGLDPHGVHDVWRDYFASMPEIQPFQRRAAEKFRARGYMLSLLSRRARLDDPHRDYTALNRLLQCGNADILKLKMVECDEYLQTQGGDASGVHMLLNCHDALSWQFAEDARPLYEDCLAIAQDFASPQAVIKLDLPVTMDHGEGPTWAIATYGEKKK